jgi:hypothetical protein
MSVPLTAVSAITVGTTLANATPLAFGSKTMGRILNRSGGAITPVVHECDTSDGTYVLCDDVGTAGALSEIANNESLALPSGLQGCKWLKFVDAAAANAVVTVITKG